MKAIDKLIDLYERGKYLAMTKTYQELPKEERMKVLTDLEEIGMHGIAWTLLEYITL